MLADLEGEKSGPNKGSKSKKKKKAAAHKHESPEESKDLSPVTMTDEDEFKSAESKTPPKEKYTGPDSARAKSARANEAEDDTEIERRTLKDDSD